MQQRGGGVELAVYGDDALMFELAPISLWLQDLSEVKTLFADWRRAGVTRLRDFLLENPDAQEPAGNAVACSRSTGEPLICSRPAIRNNWWII
jgi:hypothetical protein